MFKKHLKINKLIETILLNKIGVLLVNLGSPDKPSFFGIIKFLRQFLWDKRVVNSPRLSWFFLLYLFILPFRSFKVSKAYRSIWTREGSPLKVLTKSLAERLNTYLRATEKDSISVRYAMTYGKPNIQSQIEALQSLNITQLIIVPLFPQYSSTTTAAVFDSLAKVMSTRINIPSFSFIHEYALEEAYLEALKESILNFWERFGMPEQLIFSFHGIPKALYDRGDSYPDSCVRLAKTLAKKLNLSENFYKISFQSRFGFAKWVKPYLQAALMDALSLGHQSVDVVAPSFAVDCLETLEELEVETRKFFLKKGGKSFRYIPALNDNERHIIALAHIIKHFFKKN